MIPRMPDLLRIALPCLLLLAACTDHDPYALGTLERERIALPAPVAERIAEIAVREGQAVAAGDLLMVLEPERTAARGDAAQAELARAEAALEEARNGPRTEAIAQAEANLRGAEGIAADARAELARVGPLVEHGALARAELDHARANAIAATSEAQAARESLTALRNGTRREQIAQAEAAVAAAQAAVASVAVDVARTRITAPRAGLVDSLPFEVGDQVPIGTALAILLVGEHPYARVYVPQPQRASVHIGSLADVRMHGSDTVYRGRVRAIRSEPGFTPYFALAGDDASRLSWLAEIELGADAVDLPVGMPVRAEFSADADVGDAGEPDDTTQATTPTP